MIDLKNITKIYQNQNIEILAIKDVTLTIHSGDFISVFGQSGSGKTTLMNIIGLMDEYSSGTYFFEGADIREFSARKLAKIRNASLGFIFQQFHLIQEMNIIDNVCTPMGYYGMSYKERQRRAHEVLHMVGLLDKSKKYPKQLSGGEQQRIAIARAIALKPKILLADEPTGNLDNENGANVIHILMELNRNGTALILNTHDIHIVEKAPIQIQLKNNTIIKRYKN